MSIELNKNIAKFKPKYTAIEATVIRANGKIEKLGVVAEQHYTLSGWLKSKFFGFFKRKR